MHKTSISVLSVFAPRLAQDRYVLEQTLASRDRQVTLQDVNRIISLLEGLVLPGFPRDLRTRRPSKISRPNDGANRPCEPETAKAPDSGVGGTDEMDEAQLEDRVRQREVVTTATAEKFLKIGPRRRQTTSPVRQTGKSRPGPEERHYHQVTTPL